MAFRETTFDHNAILLFGNFSLKRNAPGRSIMVLTTLFECGRESRFDEGEANENGPKSCTVRLSKMSKNYERKFWLAESRRTSGLVGKIVN